MQEANLTFTESVEGALMFSHEGRNFLYAGRKDGFVYGVRTDANGRWQALVGDAANREYELVGTKATQEGMDFIVFDLAHIKIDTLVEVQDLVKQRDELDDLAISTISKSDCRKPDGISIGLIDGMLAMARVLRKSDLSAKEVQEALKDLQADEDMKFLMYSATLVPMAQCDTDWEFGEEEKVLVPADEPVLIAPAAVALAKAPEPPKDGSYKVVFAQKTWPCGWDQEDSTTEFPDRDALNAWLLGKIEWCKYEDNGFRCRVYRYDNNFPYSVGKAEWTDKQFTDVGLSWKPTVEILSDMEWMK
jgi:hypothetical protein